MAVKLNLTRREVTFAAAVNRPPTPAAMLRGSDMSRSVMEPSFVCTKAEL